MQAQENKKPVTKHEIIIHQGIVYSNIIWFSSFEGGGSYEGGTGFVFGISYSRKYTEKLWFVSGLSIIHAHNVFNEPVINPAEVPKFYTIHTDVLQALMQLRYDVSRVFYLKPGISIDYHIDHNKVRKIDNQSGFAINLAPGFRFVSGRILNGTIEPQFRLLALYPFVKERFHDHLVVISLNLCFEFPIK